MVLAVLVLRPLAAAAGPVLTNDSVSGVLSVPFYNCILTQITSPAVVGSGVEFTGVVGVDKVCHPLAVSVDMGESDLSVTFTGSTNWISNSEPLMTLSLSDLDFTPGAIITGVTATNCAPVGCSSLDPLVTFTDHSIDLAFRTLASGYSFAFDITTTDPTVVPEPSSLSLLAAGLGSFIVRRARRQRG
jgi:hypothetical protein